ncbi:MULTISPECIES: nucleoside phosphorylase [unclassified Lentimicrobium]|uniref:nucleoside phosphorylase n=1 Tax=unclassified Lentimicrobium TaxID=2677434 RepID=UPI001558214E|nr:MULTISPECIES: nucleoside phosphorylase [unclassified Lentimicrobium]NPD48197.1 nucleoside phosphorylase [Lentimicrobium sp. S6]NPD86425.1 nucleoside phosphorylase [Lentimicrobium sp. L6]
MNKKAIAESELIINPDGSIYHLHLHPENIANDIILVGDPGRVEVISSYFDQIEFKMANREIHTHTGYIGKKRITVLSTGMGTDNLDIVINELDAICNIDLKTRIPKDSHRSLRLYRLGTSGALQPEIPVDTFLASSHGVGIDGLLWFYEQVNSVIDKDMTEAFLRDTNWPDDLPKAYIVPGSEELLNTVGKNFMKGITATAPGFFGPQGRVLRMPLAYPDLNDRISSFSYQGQKLTNFEMETSALYGLSKALGHHAMTVCAIIANRERKEYSKDYKITVVKLIEELLEQICQQ